MSGRRSARFTSLVEAATLSAVDLFKGQRLFLLERGRVQTFRAPGKHK
jgi:hypothetical protein